MSYLRLYYNLEKNGNIVNILQHLLNVQGKEDHEIRGFGKILKGYGLKQIDFDSFKKQPNKLTTKIFRDTKDGLIHRGLIQVFDKSDRIKNGPFFCITPLGIVFLIQNSKPSSADIKKSINIVMQYFKGKKKGLEFDKLGEYIWIFKKSCNLFKFNEEEVTIQTEIYPNHHFDLSYLNYTLHPKLHKENFEKAAYYLIANMCWLVVSIFTPAIPLLESDEKKELKKIVDSLPKEINTLGISFGQKIADILDATNVVVKEIVNAKNYSYSPESYLK